MLGQHDKGPHCAAWEAEPKQLPTGGLRSSVWMPSTQRSGKWLCAKAPKSSAPAQLFVPVVITPARDQALFHGLQPGSHNLWLFGLRSMHSVLAIQRNLLPHHLACRSAY